MPSTDTGYTLGEDVLYALTIRAQELDLYRDRAQISLRYAPIFDDPAQLQQEHFKLLVVELLCELPPDVAQDRLQTQELELLKCGWQLTVHTSAPCRADAVPEDACELPLLLARISDAVGLLCERAGLAHPLTEETQARLVAHYRARFTADGAAAGTL